MTIPEILPTLAPLVLRADPPPDNTTTTTTTTTGDPPPGGGGPGGGGPSGQNSTSSPSSTGPSSAQSSQSSVNTASNTPPPQNTTSLPPTTTTTPSLTVLPGNHTSTVVIGITITPSDTPTVAAKAASTPKSFFQNTGAVAGTFSVVGVIGLLILFFAITATMRRRREKKWDREVAEAAREAATAPVPVFLDDEDDQYGPGPFSDHGNAAGYGGGNGFSDVSSHGTYGQAPMSHEMSERGYGGGGYDPNAAYYGGAGAAAGAAGIGVVRARSQRNPDQPPPGGDPYAAFATSTGMQNHPDYNAYGRNASPPPVPLPPTQWQGANDGGYAIAAAMHNNGYPQQEHPHAAYANQPFASSYANPVPGQMRSVSPPVALNRGLSTKTGQSDGTNTTGSGSGAASQTIASPESYASHYTPNFDASKYKPGSNPHDIPSTDIPTHPTTETAVEDDAYGGYEDHSPGGLPNPFESKGDSDDEDVGAYAIGGSHDGHFGGGGRVLKVANAEVDDD